MHNVLFYCPEMFNELKKREEVHFEQFFYITTEQKNLKSETLFCYHSSLLWNTSFTPYLLLIVVEL